MRNLKLFTQLPHRILVSPENPNSNAAQDLTNHVVRLAWILRNEDYAWFHR